MHHHNITISSTDYERLREVIESARLDWRIPQHSLHVLEGELARATIVEPPELPPDVIAMNSTLWFQDLDTQETGRYQLVCPDDADVIHRRISILSPIGTALLGFRRGDTVAWQLPHGRRRLAIKKVVQSHRNHEVEPDAILI